MFSKVMLMLSMLICAASALAQEEAFFGKWDITGTASRGRYVYWLEVKKEDGVLVGYFLNRVASVYKLPEISIKDGELTFPIGRPADKQIFRARVQGGKLVGTISGGKETISIVGVRPPKWKGVNANAKHKFGNPIELFNGKDLSNWDVEHKDKPSGWRVEDGVMTNSPGANNLVSKEKFSDFRIHAEYKLDKGSNSGIYLRGRYELQLLDDFGKEPESHGHMAIYSRLAPRVNASKPAGQWQTMEATIVGNRVTVFLNGQKVHDNAVIEGITGGALDADEGSPGPIMLQGDHGKVWFRKVTVIPIIK
jgi:hypothetical protein